MKTKKEQPELKSIEQLLSEIHEQAVIARDAQQEIMAKIRDMRMQMTAQRLNELEVSAKGK